MTKYKQKFYSLNAMIAIIIFLSYDLMILDTPANANVIEIDRDGSVIELRNDLLVRSQDTVPVEIKTTISNKISKSNLRVVETFAAQYELSADLVDAIALVESGFKQNVVSRTGATGIMQLMPKTAAELNVDRFDGYDNIRGGTAYLRTLLNRFNGDIVRTIAAYNAGPGAVDRAGGVPRYPETIAYVNRVLDRLADAAQ